MKNKGLSLGYACINTTLRKRSIFSSRTMRLVNANLHSIDEAIKANLDDTLTILKWNVAHNIYVFRISSELFPHLTNKKYKHAFYSLEPYYLQIKAIGDYARANGMRISFHCTPYNILGSARSEVVENTINDLTYIYGQFIKIAGVPMNVVIHFGCLFSNEAAKRWIVNFRRLPVVVRRSLVLENDECVNTDKLLPICKKLKIPLLFDIFHWTINNNCTVEQLLPGIIDTWKYRKNMPIKMHISEQAPDGRKGAHSDYVRNIQPILLKFANKYPLDIIVEAKQKEKATLYLQKKYREHLFIGGSSNEKPSAYKSMRLCEGECPNRRGEGLRRWVDEQWVDVLSYLDGEVIQCRRACRPIKHINDKTPLTIDELIAIHGKKKLRNIAQSKVDNMNKRMNWKSGIFYSK